MVARGQLKYLMYLPRYLVGNLLTAKIGRLTRVKHYGQEFIYLNTDTGIRNAF